MATEKKDEIILGQWQTCVEMANAISQRRDTANNVFITINLALFASIPFSFNKMTCLVLLMGIFLCFLWLRIIINFKLLNTEKFKIINKLEEKLPAQPFKDEWKELKSNRNFSESTSLEYSLPILFIFVYVILFLILLFTPITAK